MVGAEEVMKRRLALDTFDSPEFQILDVSNSNYKISIFRSCFKLNFINLFNRSAMASKEMY